MRAELVRQLKGDEGVIPHAYPDHLGYLTIGVGRLIDKRKGGGLRPDEITYLLNNDIDNRIEALTRALPWFQNLDDARKGVLLNMAFQLGTEGLLGFQNTLAMIRDGEYDRAADAMLASKWATQTPERAKRMSDQMRDGAWRYA
jgi:lysozyme